MIMISLLYKLGSQNDVSQRTRRAAKITSVLIIGMPLCKDGNFMPALEGLDESVFALYAKIERGAKHIGKLNCSRDNFRRENSASGRWRSAISTGRRKTL